MTAWVVSLGLMLVTAGKPPVESAADTVTLRDGQVVLGHLIEPSPRAGSVALVARRAWIEAKLPQWAKRWLAEVEPAERKAEAQRRQRLESWKRERAGKTEPDDRIDAWIDHELARLKGEAEKPASVLIPVIIAKSDVRSIVRRPKSSQRLLLLGWRAGFASVEEMPLDALKDALEGRGFDLASTVPVSVEHMLPLQPETDVQWIARRAATEVTHDSGLKFIQVQQLLLPEPEPGQPLNAGAALSALPDLVKMLTGEATDPMPERLRAVSDRGRVGAIVTKEDLDPNLESVSVEIMLWVRGPGNRWAPFGWRKATVRAADVGQDEGKDLADDPQVQMIFSLAKSLGLGDAGGEVQQKGLQVGAATRKALGQARTAFQEDLARLALSLEERAQAKGKD